MSAFERRFIETSDGTKEVIPSEFNAEYVALWDAFNRTAEATEGEEFYRLTHEASDRAHLTMMETNPRYREFHLTMWREQGHDVSSWEVKP